MQTDYRLPTIPPAPSPHVSKPGHRTAIVAAVIGIFFLGVLLALLVTTRGSLSGREADLASARGELSAARADLLDSRKELAAVEDDLDRAESSLAETKVDLAAAERNFDATAECSFGALSAWYETLDGSYDMTGRALQRIVYSGLCREVRQAYKRSGGASGGSGFGLLQG